MRHPEPGRRVTVASDGQRAVYSPQGLRDGTVALLRMGAASALLYAGAVWLAFTPNLENLILNAAALVASNFRKES